LAFITYFLVNIVMPFRFRCRLGTKLTTIVLYCKAPSFWAQCPFSQRLKRLFSRRCVTGPP